MLLRRREDEDGVCRRLLQCLEKGVEGSLRQHVHLIYYVDAVFAHLRRYPHLVHQGLDVIHSVIGGGIQFMDTV